MRHSSLTEKAQLIGEYELRLHADWTTTSPMPRHYLHFGGNESVPALLKAQGIISDEESLGNKLEEENTALKPSIICLNCREANKPDSSFCSNPKCGMVLKYSAYNETIGEAEKTKKALESIEQRTTSLQTGIEEWEQRFKKLVDSVKGTLYYRSLKCEN